MNDIAITQSNLPAQPVELAKFVLVGEEKAKAIRAEIRAIQKLKLANEVWLQKQHELQMVQEAVADAKVRIGVLFNNMPKQSGGDRRSEDFKTADVADLKNERDYEYPKTRKEAAMELGFSERDVGRFQQMAKHPEAVEQAKAEARETGEPLTTSRIIDFIQARTERDTEEYYRGIEDERQYKALDRALQEFAKVQDDAESIQAMRRGCGDAEYTHQRIRQLVAKLNNIDSAFARGSG